MQRVATEFTDLPNDMIVANFGRHLSPREMFRLAAATKTLHDLHFSNTERFWRSLTPFKLLAMPQLAAEDIVAVVEHYPELQKQFLDLSADFSSQIQAFYSTLKLEQLLKFAGACHMLLSSGLMPFDREAFNSNLPTTPPINDHDHRQMIRHALFTTNIYAINLDYLENTISWLHNQKQDELSRSLSTTLQCAKHSTLSTADLTNPICYVNLADASLQATQLQHAKLQGANLNGAKLRTANLQGASLKGADLEKANLQEADLLSADLQGARLQEASLYMTKLHYAKLQKADLQRANLYCANLRWAKLHGAKLQDAILHQATLHQAELQGAQLAGAYMRAADLRWTNLQEANLQGAKLQMANLQETNLRMANLQSANLRLATLQGANLQGANLQGTNLEGADLNGAIFFDQNDLSSAEQLKNAMDKFYNDYRDNEAFAVLRSSMLADLIKQITHSPAAGAQQQLTTPDQDLKINLLEAAYQHPLFNEHRHLTIIRDAINAIYRAMSSLSCCGLFGARFKRDLIETRSQSVLNETLNTVNRLTQASSV